MSKVTVNGVEYALQDNDLLVVIGTTVMVNHQAVGSIDQKVNTRVEISGDLLNLTTNRDVKAEAVKGNVSATGDVTVNSGGCGNISATGDVTVTGNVGGNISATGDVKCGDVSGNIKTTGDVTTRRK